MYKQKVLFAGTRATQSTFLAVYRFDSTPIAVCTINLHNYRTRSTNRSIVMSLNRRNIAVGALPNNARSSRTRNCVPDCRKCRCSQFRPSSRWLGQLCSRNMEARYVRGRFSHNSFDSRTILNWLVNIPLGTFRKVLFLKYCNLKIVQIGLFFYVG